MYMSASILKNTQKERNEGQEGQEENPGKLTETLPSQKFTTLLASINLLFMLLLSQN